MADISINPVNNINTAPVHAPKPHDAQSTGVRTGESKAAETIREAAEAQKERSAEIRREQLEDVISVSKDGDTVQATDKSMERLAEDQFGHMEVKDETPTDSVNSDAIKLAVEDTEEETESQQAIRESIYNALEEPTVTEEAIESSAEKTVAQPTRTEEAIELGNERAEEEEAEEEYDQKLASYQGISDMKLEQMYIQGEISKREYDQEMESREETREAQNADDQRFTAQMTGTAVLRESGRRDLNEIETATSEDANDNLTGAQRLEIIETLESGRAQAVIQQDAANMVTDDNTSGEETIKKIVFS
ncbi:MAG: hypothetical protein IJU43_02380 [Lachnospiraceae bacterium]|nr:hypothetical protein [Lachnospiraceae bacterium]